LAPGLRRQDAVLKSNLQGLGLLQLVAHRERVHYPLIVGFVARAEPEGGGNDHGRQHRGDDKAPIQQNKRFRLGQMRAWQ